MGAAEASVCFLPMERTSPARRQEEEAVNNLQGMYPALVSPVMPIKLWCCRLLITVLTAAVVALYVALSVRKPQSVIQIAAYSSCPKNWIGFGSKCFYFSEDTDSCTHSQASCETLGAELAQFESLEELDILMRYKGSYHHWIGLHRESSQQPWKWTDNTEYNNMMEVHGEGTCAYLSSDRISSSRDGPPRRWICSKPSTPDLQCPKPSPYL